MSGFFRGTNVDQDTRFGDKGRRESARMTFPEHFRRKVDMSKVQLQVMEPWVLSKVVEIMGTEDEILVKYVMSQLTASGGVDPKVMQVNITGFLEGSAPAFMSELWRLLVAAQTAPGGIPPEFVEKKKEELRLKKLEQEELDAELRQRKESAAQAELAARALAESAAREMQAGRRESSELGNAERALYPPTGAGDAAAGTAQAPTGATNGRGEQEAVPDRPDPDRLEQERLLRELALRAVAKASGVKKSCAVSATEAEASRDGEAEAEAGDSRANSASEPEADAADARAEPAE